MSFRRVKAGLAGATLVLVLAPALASAAADDVVSSPAASGGSSPAATIRYWTAERMRRAQPVTTTLRHRLEQARAPKPEPSGPPRYVAGTDAPFMTYSGAPATYPDRTHGKVFFKLGRNSHVCSATVVSSQAGNVVLTAGHCVHGGGRRKDFASKWVFVPGYDEGKRPFGKFPFKRLHALRGWTRKANFSYDIATAVVKGNKLGGVEEKVGARGIGWDQPRQLDFDVYGYPVAGSRFDHRKLYFCRTSYAFDDPDPAPKGDRPLGVGCDLTEGASGGGWVTKGPGGTAAEPFVNSVTSFGYDDLPDVLFGPYFAGNTAGKLWSRASGEPLATAVPQP